MVFYVICLWFSFDWLSSLLTYFFAIVINYYSLTPLWKLTALSFGVHATLYFVENCIYLNHMSHVSIWIICHILGITDASFRVHLGFRTCVVSVHIGVAVLCYNFSEIACVTVLYRYPYPCFLGQLVCYDLDPQCSSLSLVF